MFASSDLDSLTAWVLHQLSKGKLRLVVTSAWPGEGKSSITWEIACRLASLNSKSILIIDGDLRNPTLSHKMQLVESGLANLASQKFQIRPSPLGTVDKLFGLGSGKIKREDITHTIQHIIKENRIATVMDNFDLVLIDCPPTTACEDASIFGEICDGVLLVVSKTKFRGLKHLQLKQFTEKNIRIFGTVVTHAARTQSRVGAILALLGLRS